MSVAAAAGIHDIIVLDRPNPIGGRVRAPLRALPSLHYRNTPSFTALL
jgi:uncharacterized protein YbbC (DUF1343 family)